MPKRRPRQGLGKEVAGCSEACLRGPRCMTPAEVQTLTHASTHAIYHYLHWEAQPLPFLPIWILWLSRPCPCKLDGGLASSQVAGLTTLKDDVVYWYSFSNHYTKRAFTQP